MREFPKHAFLNMVMNLPVNLPGSTKSFFQKFAADI